MKKRSSAPAAYAKSETLTARTGEHCPETGWWHPVQAVAADGEAATRFVGEGSLMPAVAGVPALWVPSRT